MRDNVMIVPGIDLPLMLEAIADVLAEDRPDAVASVAYIRMAADRLRAQPSPREVALEKALQSIAKNTCCDRCQEAALVAKSALSVNTARMMVAADLSSRAVVQASLNKGITGDPNHGRREP